MKKPNPDYLNNEIADLKAVRYVRHRAIEELTQQKIASMQAMTEAPELRALVNDLKFLARLTSGQRRSQANAEYKRLKAALNAAEVRITRLEDGRKVATSKGSEK